MVTDATLRSYEQREADFWRAEGFAADVTWKEMRGLIKTPRGLVPRTKRRDFFSTDTRSGFDVLAVFIAQPIALACIQVTASPFVQVRSGKEDRNAAHGPPPFSWAPPKRSVEEWISDALTETLFEYEDPALVQVLACYADGPRHVERRWWWADPPKRTSP